MSKSYGNGIELTDPPAEVFGKTMSLDDGVLQSWFPLLTDLPALEIEELLAGHPRDAKVRLAWELAAYLHGSEAADEAKASFERQFVRKELPDEIPETVYSGRWDAEGMPLFILLRELGLAKSAAEGRRLVEQGGVRLEGQVIRDPAHAVLPPQGGAQENGLLVQVGKRRFARVRKG
jgi:tyrosyl-tRNA synthetase